MIVATAGHIDHGKTALIRALTGVDTDRLPEEKRRGISIDLGFAYWQPDGVTTIGFVDVPGHERFIGNMLAGVCGIDFVALIVAADDGIMPQTREHLDIVNLLGIRHGVAVISKADRAAAPRIDEVRDDIRSLLSETSLAGSPILAVSAVTGTGLDELRAALLAASASLRQRASRGSHLRFAVDRAFTVVGSGTVLTGTVFSGSVRAGERAVLSPEGIEVRVRGIQKRGQSADQADAGERCALNIAGASTKNAGRGNWIVGQPAHRPTRRIDCRVQVLRAEKRPVRHWMPVRLHIGTANRIARIAMPHGSPLAPGGSGIAQLVLEDPINTTHGERFIIRDFPATRTIGGGEVLDPVALPLCGKPAARMERLAAFEQPTPRAALAALLSCSPAGVELPEFEQAFNLSHEEVLVLAGATDAVIIGKAKGIALHRKTVAQIATRAVDAIRRFHAQVSEAPGMEIEALRKEAAAELGAEAFLELLREVSQGCQLAISGSAVTHALHSPKESAGQQKLWNVLRPAFDGAAFQLPRMQELVARTGLSEPEVKSALQAKLRTGEMIRVSAERFCTRSTLARLAAIAVSTAQNHKNGEFTVAQYRDSSSLGRNLVIEILECLDRLGVTLRIGAARKIRKDYASVLGPVSHHASPANGPSRLMPRRDASIS